MKKLIYCSTCNTKNQFSEIEGAIRYHCPKCKAIHYQNPKPTATLICIQNKKILLVKRAFEPAKGTWSLPGGFIELGETPEDAATRELEEAKSGETSGDAEVSLIKVRSPRSLFTPQNLCNPGRRKSKSIKMVFLP